MKGMYIKHCNVSINQYVRGTLQAPVFKWFMYITVMHNMLTFELFGMIKNAYLLSLINTSTFPVRF